jgi:hypothetical protein
LKTSLTRCRPASTSRKPTCWQGEKKRAVQMYQELLRLDPENEKATEALKKLTGIR